jgi:fructosamine-3-kinase
LSEIASLIEPIRSGLAAQARELDLDAATITIEPVLNWGGFINRSFRVSDGHRTLFLKLTSDPEIRCGLETWRDLALLLEARYHAPHLVGWLDLPLTTFSGPLFEWIEGSLAVRLDEVLAGEISSMVTKLHADVDVASRLPGPVRNCAQAYLQSYHDRFEEDLEFVAANPPPFVDRDRLAWLRHQVDTIEARVQRSAAFRAAADRPVHGDLWLNNVLIDHDGRWYLLDWDGLASSDSLIDWTMLFGPTRQYPWAATEEVVLSHAALTADEQQRFSVYAQASQLDWVLDPLADWVQGGLEPEHGAQVRTANERIHREALGAYQARFGS